MKSFREWLADQELIEQELRPTMPNKAWNAPKGDIIQHWEQMPYNMPLTALKYIPKGHKGSTRSFDGLRITGSSKWIDFVLSRLKDVLRYEKSGDTILNVMYRQVTDKITGEPVPDSYVFYVQAHGRSNTAKIRKPHKIKAIPLHPHNTKIKKSLYQQ